MLSFILFEVSLEKYSNFPAKVLGIQIKCILNYNISCSQPSVEGTPPEVWPLPLQQSAARSDI